MTVGFKNRIISRILELKGSVIKNLGQDQRSNPPGFEFTGVKMQSGLIMKNFLPDYERFETDMAIMV